MTEVYITEKNGDEACVNEGQNPLEVQDILTKTDLEEQNQPE